MLANCVYGQTCVPVDLRAGEAARDHVVTCEAPVLRVHVVTLLTIAESTDLIKLRLWRQICSIADAARVLFRLLLYDKTFVRATETLSR